MSAARVSGYSGTPLAKKLGMQGGIRVHVVRAPRGYRKLLGALAGAVRFVPRADRSIDFVHHFSLRKAELARALAAYRRALGAHAAVWVSWPKKSANVPTDLTEDVVRELALPLGFVDIKVCAIDETWSGLKLVVRKALR